jgi:polyisoprenoid-binding protein YceI
MSAESSTTTSLPLAPGEWPVDPNHSGVNFRIRHMGLSNVRGRFDRFDATLVVGTSLEDSKVTASIDMASVDTNQADRDAHLRGTDFFSTDQHPAMTFASTAIRLVSGSDYEVDGDLTINGIAKPVTLEVEFSGVEVVPMDGSTHAGFSATTEINRNDYGIDFNMPLGVDKVALGQKVKVELDLQFVAPKAE